MPKLPPVILLAQNQLPEMQRQVVCSDTLLGEQETRFAGVVELSSLTLV